MGCGTSKVKARKEVKEDPRPPSEDQKDKEQTGQSGEPHIPQQPPQSGSQGQQNVPSQPDVTAQTCQRLYPNPPMEITQEQQPKQSQSVQASAPPIPEQPPPFNPTWQQEQPWQSEKPPNSALQQAEQPNQQWQGNVPSYSTLQQQESNPPWQHGQPSNSGLQQGQSKQQWQVGQPPNLAWQQGQPNSPLQGGPSPSSAWQQGKPNPPCQDGQPPNSAWQQRQLNQQWQDEPPLNSVWQQGQPNQQWQGGQPPNSAWKQEQPNPPCQDGQPLHSAWQQRQPNQQWQDEPPPNSAWQQGQPNQQWQGGPSPNSAWQQGQPNPPCQDEQPPNSVWQKGQPNQQWQGGELPNSAWKQGQPNPPWQGGPSRNSALQQGQPNQQWQGGQPPNPTWKQGQPNLSWQGGQATNSAWQQGQPNRQWQGGPPPNSASNSAFQQGQPNQQWQGGQPANPAWQQEEPNPPWQGGQPLNLALQRGQPNQQWQSEQLPNTVWQERQPTQQRHGRPPIESELQQGQRKQQWYGGKQPKVAWQEEPLNPLRHEEHPPNAAWQEEQPNPPWQSGQPIEQLQPSQPNRPLQFRQQPDQSWQTEQLETVQGKPNSQIPQQLNHPHQGRQVNQTSEEHNTYQPGQSQKETNKTISVGVDPDLMEYIECSRYKDELEKSMRKEKIKIHWSQGSNYATLEYTGETNESWQTECVKPWHSFLSNFAIRDLPVQEEIWEDVEIEMSDIRASLGDNPPLIKSFKDRLTLRIVSLCSDIERCRSHLEAKLTELYRAETFQNETISNVSKEHIHLFKAINFKEKRLREKCKEVEIDLDEGKQEIRLAGPRDQLKIAMTEFQNQVRATTEKTLGLDPDFVQVLFTEQGQKAVKEALEGEEIEAIMVFSTGNQYAKVLASSEENATESASLISGLLTKDKLNVTANHQPLITAKPWQDYCEKTKKKTGVLIRDRSNSSGEIWIVGLSSNVDKAVRKLQYFLDHNAETEEGFRCPSSDVREYILRRVKPEIEKYGVEVKEGEDILSFYISGQEERLQKAEDLLHKLGTDVATSNVEFEQPGLIKFSESGELDARVKEVEEREKCFIRVEKHLTPMTPASGGSNGSGVPTLPPPVGSSGVPGGNNPSHLSSSGSAVIASTIHVTPQGQKISWTPGDITIEQAHALVIPQGACFNKIRSAFSPVICQAVDDLKVGEIATSSGASLPCNHVIHCCCSFWDGSGNKGEGTLRTIVQKSLHEVGQLGGNSIAFPVIGTGNLGFPPNEACRTMLDETVKFCQRNPHSLVKDIRFVVFTGDKSLVDAFQKEASKIQNQGTNTAHSTVGVNWSNIIEIANGDLTKESTDAIVNINSITMDMNSAGELGKAVAKASGPQVQQECNQLGVQQAGSAVMTSGGNLLVPNIIHIIPGSSDKQHLQQCLEEGLRLADNRNRKSVSIPAIGTGGYGLSAIESAQVTFQAVKNVYSTFTCVCKVRIVIYQATMVQAFQTEQQKHSAVHYKIPPSLATPGSPISIDVINGDLTKERTDAIVNINSITMDMNSAGELGKAVAKASGPQVQQECNQLGAQPAGSAVMTSGGSLLVPNIIHIIPGSSDKQHLQQCLEKGLRLAENRNLKSISIPAIGTGGYGLSASDSAQVTFQAVRNVSGSFSSVSKVRIVVFQATMVQAFQQEQQNPSVIHNKVVPSLATPGSPISIDVINGDLTKESTDAIVNINSTTMNMNLAGELGKAVAKASGPQVQQECNNLGSQSPGSAVMTSGGNLSVPHIVHIIPGSSDKQHLQQCLEEGLRLADKRNLKSVSIPAIGTGGYGLSASDSAQVTFQAVRNVYGNFTSVSKIRIVVYQATMVQAFQQEQQKPLVVHNNVVPSLATPRSPISIDVINGDLTKESTDAIVNINSTTMNMNLAGELGKAVAKASGPQVQQECNNLGSQPAGSAVMTSGGNLLVAKIIHIVPGSSDKQHLRQCLEEGLRLADTNKLKSISIPAIGTGGYGLSAIDSANVVFEALGSFSGNFVNISKVRIVVYQSGMMQAFLQEKIRLDTHGSSRPASAMRQSWKPTVRVWVTGKNSGSVGKALDQLKETFSKACVTTTVSTEDIAALSQKQINNLQREAYKCDTEIKFNYTAKCVMVRGYHGNVHDIASKIKDEISKGIKEKTQMQEDDNAKMISKMVQWSYESNGRKTAFDLRANAKLEMAHSKKDLSVKVTSLGEEFVVDMKTLVGRCGSNSKQVKISRNSKEGHQGIPLPDNWSPMPAGKNVRSVQLLPGSPEYQAVKSKFHTTLSRENIVNIERIQNPLLYQTYMVRKQKMDKDTGGNSERQLFHGTDGKNINQINSQGFNRSFCGVNGTLYGRGVYFARDASYSANPKYSVGATGNRKMYLARVLVGQYCAGNSQMITAPPKNPAIPTVPYDSVVDNPADPTIFVVFYDNTCYPEYLITF